MKAIAEAIKPLAEKCANEKKELHLLLLGCNTITLIPDLKNVMTLDVQKYVTVLCTSEAWPSDCASLLWSLYGHYARAGDLHSFRAGTRNLLGEYTAHYIRQRIVDDSRKALKLNGSLANAVHCQRLDSIEACSRGGDVKMELL